MNNKLDTAIKLLENDRSQILYAIFRNMTSLGFTRWIPDEQYIKIMYRLSMGKKLNLTSPSTFNEKLQYLKLHDRRKEYITLVDKYRVRDYIVKKIGEEYLIPLIGVWDTTHDIDFETLPEQFVLKCNHDSGSVFVCKNKHEINKQEICSKMQKSLKTSGFWFGREWPYKNVKACVIAEKYMVDSRFNELRDFKFFCFNGKVKCFKIDYDRFTEHKANYYAPDGTLLKFGEKVCPPDYSKELYIPENLNEMICLAEKLAVDYAFVRVDFYNIDGKIYFGEMTFYPASGFGQFIPEEWDKILGDWLLLKI